MTPNQATATPDQLHAEIMNLPCNVPKGYAPGKADEAVYRIGHRDARHAAAELVLARSSVPTPMSDSNDAIKADWDRVMSGLAPMSDSTVAAGGGDRFFMDHGMWHDRVTGQHLHTDDQHSAALAGAIDPAWVALEAAGIARDGWLTLPEAIQKLAARASLSATPADIRGLARAELRQTRVPAPAVAAITPMTIEQVRQAGVRSMEDAVIASLPPELRVHPAAPQTSVPTAAPLHGGCATGRTELPARLSYSWPPKSCPCGSQMGAECLEAGDCKWQADPSLVPESLRQPSPLKEPGKAVRMLTEDETQEAYALQWKDDNFLGRDPTWMDRMNATMRRFCEVNALDLKEGN